MPRFLDVTDMQAARDALGVDAGTLNVTAVKTAGYSAAVGEIVPADATAGGFTITLPEAPADGSRIIVKKLDDTANTVLVQRTGADVFNQAGGPSALQLSKPSQSAVLRYGDGVWHVVSNSYGPSVFDDDFAPKLSDRILDVNGNRVIGLGATTNGVNYVKISNNIASASPPVIEVVGPGANIPLRLQAKSSSVQNYTLATTATFAADGPGGSIVHNITSKGPLGSVRANNVVICDVSTAQTLTGKTLSAAQLTGATAVAQSGTLAVYNSADQTTNYERFRAYWDSNVLWILSENGGSGTRREMRIGNGGAVINLPGGPSSNGAASVNCTNTGSPGVVQFKVYGGMGASSGIQYGVVVSPTMSQTGTGGYTALLINPAETSNTGTGAKLLVDAQVGGTTKFKVSNTGAVSVSGTAATISSGTGTPEGAVTAVVGSLYTDTSGGAGSTLYVKESGSGNTGWVAK